MKFKVFPSDQDKGRYEIRQEDADGYLDEGYADQALRNGKEDGGTVSIGVFQPL